jgi:hypothetical protein
MGWFELVAGGVLIVSVGLLFVGFRMVGKRPFWSATCKVLGTVGVVETLGYLVATAWLES